MNRRQFYKMVFALVLPMAVQNLINVGVTTADVVMLGRVGETALSAASLANQVSFVLNLFLFGISSGAAVLTAQYWGKNDTRTIEKVLGMVLQISLLVGAIFMIISLLIPQHLLRIFTSEALIIQEGIPYLRLVSFTYVLMAFNMVYLNLMRSVERVMIGMVTYAMSLAVNVFFNAIFIFGLLGMPAMGTAGAALGTLLARCLEFIIIMIYNQKFNNVLRLRRKDLFHWDRVLLKDFMHYSLPVVVNELAWGLGMAAISAIVGHLGAAAVAAHAVTQNARQLAMVLTMGISNAAAIVLGKTIGAGKEAEARLYGKRFCSLAVGIGIFGAFLIMAIVRPISLAVLTLTPLAGKYLQFMMMLLSVYCLMQSINCTLIVGVFRAGGDTKVGFYLDTISMWLGSICMGAAAAFLLHLPMQVIYALLLSDELLKLPFVIKRYRSRRWLQNVTR